VPSYLAFGIRPINFSYFLKSYKHLVDVRKSFFQHGYILILESTWNDDGSFR